MVVFNENKVQNPRKKALLKLKKTLKVGLLGALNGIRMRKWYSNDLSKYITIENIEQKCLHEQIVFKKIETINSESTVDLFKTANADLAISLGNGYIPKKIFSIPKYGMINIHHELLPEYQNAQSIIWQIFNKSPNTGFTIHKIDKHIDTGEIILQEVVSIEMRDSLADTVTYTFVKLLKQSAIGLIKVLENFDLYFSNGTKQGIATTYTTPTIWQYLVMCKNFLKLRKSNK